jgi:DNA-binding transcriptional regulator YiaG
MTDTTTMQFRVAAARDALRTHDRLRRIKDGNEEQYRPALTQWQRAMQLLALALGDEFPGRHPAQFRPVCEQIVARADAADAAVAVNRSEDQDPRSAALRAMREERNAARAEQLRARGLSDREVARRIGVGLATVRTWFHLQDELIFTDDLDRSELDAVAGGGR